MNKELRTSYETMGSSSYMTVMCPSTVGLVNFELEMMMSNEVKNFLPVSRQMLDGETVIYYNITSRISLRQVLDKRKLSRKELICIIEGAILAVRDAAAFRLASDGIVLEPDYIYVNPASCTPVFMFTPVEVRTGHGIKELISELILHDNIEMSNDNFIQILLKELNRQPFSLEQLEQSLAPYKIPENGKEREHNVTVNPLSSVKPTVPQPEIPKPIISQPEKLQPVTPPPMNLSAKKSTTANKKKFLLPQALVMVAIAASISFGVFTDINGEIALKNVLVFAIILAVVEVILYREAYVNGKEQKKEKGLKTPPPLPVKPAKLLPDNLQSVAQEPNRQLVSQQISIPNPKYIQQPVPQYPSYSTADDTDLGDETELWDSEGENDAFAYLEYCENGEMIKIPLMSSNGVVIGRLKQQVDIAVKSLKVGKVHARFFCQEGQYYVMDINSKNGTYINGSEMRIESNIAYSLHDRDKIMLADSEFIIHCSES